MAMPNDIYVFHKHFSERNAAGVQRFSYRGVAFRKNLSNDHKEFFDPSVPKTQSEPFADMLAAVYTHVLTRPYKPDDRLMRDAFCTCEQIMHDLGYELAATLDDIAERHRGHRAALLVPGCQSRRLIKQRAVVGAQIYHRLYNNGVSTRCLLSGARPDRPTVTIWNESVDMNRHFRQELATNEGKRIEELSGMLKTVLADNIHLDGTSERTAANVAEFMERVVKIEEKASSQKPFRLIVAVSSTYHLIRLAGFLGRALEAHWGSTPPDWIDELEVVLIGAETDQHLLGLDESPIVWSREYVKPLFFETLNYLVRTGKLPEGD